MTITRWDPFRDVIALQNRMNSLFQDYTRGQGESDPVTTATFVPPVDIYEDEHGLPQAGSPGHEAERLRHPSKTTL